MVMNELMMNEWNGYFGGGELVVVIPLLGW